MLYSIKTGKPAFDRVHGAALYDFLASHPREAAVFYAAMRGFSTTETAAILTAYDFPDDACLVDVGGGEGTLLAALLKAYPQATGLVLDLAAAAQEAQHVLTRNSLQDRARFVSGDFFKAIPKGGDVYVLKSVIHNWPDDEAVVILGNCRAAMAPGARLLVIERVIPEGSGPSEAKLFDINMLVAVGGQERSEAEYRKLLEIAGFDLMRVIATASPLSLVEAKPA
jgi:hypothetical protein